MAGKGCKGIRCGGCGESLRQCQCEASGAEAAAFLKLGESAEIVVAALPPSDGREWESQCSRCGSSTTYEECTTCGGDGYMDDDEEEFGVTYGVRIMCGWCDGKGGWYRCLSARDWCADNPIPGREVVAIGTVEWFPVVRS